MNTKMKIVTSLILTGSLISTPMGSILEKSNSIAKAMDNYNKFSTVKAGDIIDGKKVEKVEKINTKKVFKDMYEEGVITKEQYDNATSIMNDRAYGGEDKLVYFHDAVDVYISYHTLTALGLFTGTAVLSFFIKAGISVIGGVAGWYISKYTYSNGVVAYLKKVTVPICAGGNCLIGQYTTKYAFHHFRSQ